MKHQSKPAKQKLYCLSRDFTTVGCFSFRDLGAIDAEKAWQEIEENIATNMSQDWLITAEEVRYLKQLLENVE